MRAERKVASDITGINHRETQQLSCKIKKDEKYPTY